LNHVRYISKEELESEIKKLAEEFEQLDCPGADKFFTELSDRSIDEFEKVSAVSAASKAYVSAAAEPLEEK
jgi:hypothetical protein